MGLFFKIALAIDKRCFSPPDNLTPFSPITVSYLSGNFLINSSANEYFAASSISSSDAFGFAYALIERTHTRIDIVLGHVPRLLRNSLNIFTYALVTGAALFITRYAYQALNESLLFNSHSPTPLQTPMWIPQGIWFAGLIVFSGTAIAMFVHLLIQNYRDSERAYFQYGPPTISEELHRELEDARARLERNEQDNPK